MTRNTFIAFVLICILAITGCRNGKFSGTSKDEQVATRDTVVVITEAKVVEDSVLLLYSRTPCFGMCPVFELKVLKSGKAFYNGKNFTDFSFLTKRHDTVCSDKQYTINIDSYVKSG